MSRKLSAITTLGALLLFITPLLNLLMMPADLFSSALLLFGIWLVLIVKAFLASRHTVHDAPVSPEQDLS